jgi:hypothetical protein
MIVRLGLLFVLVGVSLENLAMIGFHLEFQAFLWFLIICLVFDAILTRRLAAQNGNDLCVKCGYDLRATPNQCPECGAAPPNR